MANPATTAERTPWPMESMMVKSKLGPFRA